MARTRKKVERPLAPQRNRNPLTSERIYNSEEQDLIRAIDRYKRSQDRPFPTCGELLAILKSLGFRRVAEPGPLPTWPLIADTEVADTHGST